jgi:hypothetical protein
MMTYKEFFSVWEMAFVAFGGSFLEFSTPSTLGVHNFLKSMNHFWQFLVCQMC